jgi:PEGA domain
MLAMPSGKTGQPGAPVLPMRKAGLVPLGRSSQTSGDPKQAELEVISAPAGADIEIDGNFVGSTPSALSATPRQHEVVVKKAGYEAWRRKVTVTGGHVRLDAQLEADQSASNK